MVRVNYREGDWFAVPLRETGFAVGVIARASENGILLGHFFGPPRPQVPALGDLAHLSAPDAVLVGRFGPLALLDGAWPIMGQLPEWDRPSWPMPVFVRYEELTGRWFSVSYDFDDPGKLRGERQIAPVPGRQREGGGGAMGAGFVEMRLTHLLSGPAPRPN